MRRLILFIPIILLFIICVFLFIFLAQKHDPLKPPSNLINKNLPDFNMVSLFDDKKFFSKNDLDNKFLLINFFASWCLPCKAEHHLFFEIKQQYPNLFILGINMQDAKEDAIEYLKNNGNPYDYVGIDKKGFIGIEFGVVGLPETFLIDKSNKIIYKYLGPLTKKVIKNEITPLL